MLDIQFFGYKPNWAIIIFVVVILMVVFILKRFFSLNLNKVANEFIGLTLDILFPVMFLVYVFAGVIAAVISATIEYYVFARVFQGLADDKNAVAYYYLLPIVIVIAFEGVKAYLSLKGKSNFLYWALVCFSAGCTIVFCFKMLDNPLQSDLLEKQEGKIKDRYEKRRKRANDDADAQKIRLNKDYIEIKDNKKSFKPEDNPYFADRKQKENELNRELSNAERSRKAEILAIKKGYGLPVNINMSSLASDTLVEERKRAMSSINEIDKRYNSTKQGIKNRYRADIIEVNKLFNEYTLNATQIESFSSYKSKEHARIDSIRLSLVEKLDKDEKKELKEKKKEIEYSQKSHYPFFSSSLRLMSMAVDGDYEYSYRSYIWMILIFSLTATLMLEMIIHACFKNLGEEYEDRIPTGRERNQTGGNGN